MTEKRKFLINPVQRIKKKTQYNTIFIIIQAIFNFQDPYHHVYQCKREHGEITCRASIEIRIVNIRKVDSNLETIFESLNLRTIFESLRRFEKTFTINVRHYDIRMHN